MFAGNRPNAVRVLWTGVEVAIADHARMSVYLTQAIFESHLYPLQAANFRLVVDEDNLKWFKN